MLMVDSVALTVTSVCANPTFETSRAVFPAGTLNENEPSSAVAVPLMSLNLHGSANNWFTIGCGKYLALDRSVLGKR
jgi:hypothetical protein